MTGKPIFKEADHGERRYALGASALELPSLSTESVAVLRCDIVGFTRLTDKMVQRGIAGAEQLADLLNRVIARMTAILLAHGGEFVSWEGDAGVFVWRPHTGRSVQDATLLAIQAASAIHREAHAWCIDGAPIRFRSGVSCGALSRFEVGGWNGEWRTVLAGPAIAEVLAAQRMATPGRTVIGRAAGTLVGGSRPCAPLGDGFAEILEIDLAPIPQEPNPGTSPSDERGEFRSVTAAYITLRDPFYESSQDTLATLQDATLRVQSCLARFEGQFYLALASEEGVTFIAVFGLQPWSHEDDAARAARATLSLHREWGERGLTSSTGLATGRIFCGTFLASPDRAALALVGPVMNLAARLMQLNAGVVCDEETRRASLKFGRFSTRQLAPRTLKGKLEPIVAYAAYDVAGANGPADGDDNAETIGREQELAALAAGLESVRAGIGSLFVIEGDAGIGKTTLVNRTIASAHAMGVTVLGGAGDSADPSTAYAAWRRVVLSLLDRSNLTLRPAVARRELRDHDPGVRFRLAGFAAMAPLIEDLIGLEGTDNGQTANLRGQARADAQAALLRDLLNEAARAAPLLLVMEDMHWLDPTSLAFFAALGESPAPLMLLGTTRGPDSYPAVRRALEPVGCAQWLRPAPFSAEESGRLLARMLGAREAEAELATMLRDRTGGNPLFVEELSRVAFDNGLLQIDGAVHARSTVATLQAQLDDLFERRGLPRTIEGLIRRRLDVLDTRDRLVLHAASAVGQGFTADLCAAGAPSLAAAEVDRSLAALIGLGIIEPSRREGEEFVFRHAVLRDVAYNAMSFAERRRIHGAVGDWIEAQPHAEDVSAALGRHFLQAQRYDKAVRYLTAAAERAIRRYANREAVALLERALDAAQARDGAQAQNPARRDDFIHLSLLLGRAQQGLSNYAECRKHNEAGLRLAGFPSPPGAFGLGLGVLWQVLKLLRQYVRPVEGGAAASLREAVLGYEALAETYFFSGDALRTLHAALTALNLSERLGPSAELARGCATLSGITSFFRLRRASRHYSQRALAVLAKLDDPGAETWVYTLLGISRLGEGEWTEARRFLAEVVETALRVGDRRRWRDGVENEALVEACRGRWAEALVGLTATFEAARQDKDHRYALMARRERAFCQLQLGNFAAVEDSLGWIASELTRGVGTEELPTRLDAHAFAATLALEYGDWAAAAREAEAGAQAIVEIGQKSSVTNTYWSMFLIARAFGNLYAQSTRDGAGERGRLKQMAAACNALAAQAWSFPIAAPSSALAGGYLAQLRGRNGTATRRFRRAAVRAGVLDMRYEEWLARYALAATPEPAAAGLPFLLDPASARAP